MQSQMDFDYEEECEGSSDDMLADEYQAAAEHSAFQLGFGSSRPGQNDKDGNPVITVIDRSGVHEIGVRWCCCPNAPERDMQLMAAGLFPATFRNPKTAFTFRVLEEFHLDNLECKTTPSQFISRLRRLTNEEFPNTVPVGQACIFPDSRLTCRYRIDIGSCYESADCGELSLLERDSVLGTVKMKIQCPARWLYSALCARSLK
jgi:hypothetical protein